MSHIHTHTHTLDYYSTIRKKDILSSTTTLMELEGSMLSKKADTEILNALTCMQNLKK